jgi:excisionase family DNA binding protein
MRRQTIIKDDVKGDTMNKLMTCKQAAKYLCISERKLWDLQKSQRIPVVRIDRSVRFDRKDLDSFIEQLKKF